MVIWYIMVIVNEKRFCSKTVCQSLFLKLFLIYDFSIGNKIVGQTNFESGQYLSC